VQGSGHYPTSYGSLCYAEAGMIGYVTDEASGARCQWSQFGCKSYGGSNYLPFTIWHLFDRQAGIDAAHAMEDAWMYMR